MISTIKVKVFVMVVLDAVYVGSAVAAAETGGLVVAATAGEAVAVASTAATAVATTTATFGWGALLAVGFFVPVIGALIVVAPVVTGAEIPHSFDSPSLQVEPELDGVLSTSSYDNV
ncbi:membrane hypothetical protein [Alphaproteobacteria bacterium]